MKWWPSKQYRKAKNNSINVHMVLLSISKDKFQVRAKPMRLLFFTENYNCNYYLVQFACLETLKRSLQNHEKVGKICLFDDDSPIVRRWRPVQGTMHLWRSKQQFKSWSELFTQYHNLLQEVKIVEFINCLYDSNVICCKQITLLSCKQLIC